MPKLPPESTAYYSQKHFEDWLLPGPHRPRSAEVTAAEPTICVRLRLLLPARHDPFEVSSPLACGSFMAGAAGPPRPDHAPQRLGGQTRMATSIQPGPGTQTRTTGAPRVRDRRCLEDPAVAQNRAPPGRPGPGLPGGGRGLPIRTPSRTAAESDASGLPVSDDDECQ